MNIAPIESRRVLPWLLLGLPAGLLLSVAALALNVWLQGADSGGQAGPAPAPVGTAPEPLEARLRADVTTLSEKVGERSAARPEGLRAAELFIESSLGTSNIGYPVRRREYVVRERTFANLEAVLPGTEWADESVVIGAHYDTVAGSPGADDNGSGVAALLALAERFVGKPQKRTVRWVAFCNEEPPWFQTPDMGSVRFVAEMKREGVKVVAMLSLESLGYYTDEPGSQKYPEPLAALYPKTGNFLGVVGNLANRKLVDFVHERLRRTGLVAVEKGAFPDAVPGVGWSDHWSFWQEGYPAVMLTGTAPYRNPHYHLSSDRADTLDYGRLAKAVEAIELLIASLASERTGAW